MLALVYQRSLHELEDGLVAVGGPRHLSHSQAVLSSFNLAVKETFREKTLRLLAVRIAFFFFFAMSICQGLDRFKVETRVRKLALARLL